jgi:hypothetical protein
MLEAMKHGFKVFIWPEMIKQKDVNNMILKEGLTRQYICDTIKDQKNHHCGLEGEMMLTKWKRVMDRDKFNKMVAKEHDKEQNGFDIVPRRGRVKW